LSTSLLPFVLFSKFHFEVDITIAGIKKYFPKSMKDDGEAQKSYTAPFSFEGANMS